MRTLAAVALILTVSFPAGTPSRAQGDRIAPSSFTSEGNTFKGTLHVPRGDSLWINTRQTYDAADYQVAMLSVPADFPTPTCTVEFDYTVAADTPNFDRDYHWRVLYPEHYLLTGELSGKGGFLHTRARLVTDTRPPLVVASVVIHPLFTVYDQPQRISMCEWNINYKDTAGIDKIVLEVWINPNEEIMRKSYFTPDYSKVIDSLFSPIHWNKP